MIIRRIESTNNDRLLAHDAFCRTITFRVFNEIGTSASTIRENFK